MHSFVSRGSSEFCWHGNTPTSLATSLMPVIFSYESYTDCLNAAIELAMSSLRVAALLAVMLLVRSARMCPM